MIRCKWTPAAWALVLLVLAGNDSVAFAVPPPTGPSPHHPRFDRAFDVSHFIRGNLHTHTNLSDGDTSPSTVIAWYRDHGYGFLALTDHNLLSDPSAYASLQGPDFVLVAGEEITMTGDGRQVHVNALCTRETIQGGAYSSASEALTAAETSIREQGGVALVNHPNFDWALGTIDIPAIRGAHLLEIASGHPYVHSMGDGAHPSHEHFWDLALTAGESLMAVAVDDAHHYIQSADPPAYPGIGWVEAFAAETTPNAICNALRAGLLYASTGAELRRIVVRDDRYTIEPEEPGAKVVFVGDGGRVLRSNRTWGVATYQLRGDEKYVRARIEVSGGGQAWTPAVRVLME
jgi:hypothetical protein